MEHRPDVPLVEAERQAVINEQTNHIAVRDHNALRTASRSRCINNVRKIIRLIDRLKIAGLALEGRAFIKIENGACFSSG
ncbi:hypothetical protein D3C85_1753250 [compost metagenome]